MGHTIVVHDLDSAKLVVWGVHFSSQHLQRAKMNKNVDFKSKVIDLWLCFGGVAFPMHEQHKPTDILPVLLDTRSSRIPLNPIPHKYTLNPSLWPLVSAAELIHQSQCMQPWWTKAGYITIFQVWRAVDQWDNRERDLPDNCSCVRPFNIDLQPKALWPPQS